MRFGQGGGVENAERGHIYVGFVGLMGNIGFIGFRVC